VKNGSIHIPPQAGDEAIWHSAEGAGISAAPKMVYPPCRQRGEEEEALRNASAAPVPALSTPGAAATIKQTAKEGRPELSGKAEPRFRSKLK
jgi:hypothetical protein